MVSWLKRRGAHPEPTPPREAPAPVEHSPAPLAPVLPREPDYGYLPSLQPLEHGSPPVLAPMVVIGLGVVGQAVLEILADWLPVLPGRTWRGIRLLAVGLEGGPDLHTDWSNVDRAALLPEERLQLHYYPEEKRYTTDDWLRADGRQGVLQDLRDEPSALWAILQQHLGDGTNPAVWLVGSADDAVGSGMIFDLAHLVRLVGQAQNYQPPIGWMLALPGLEADREYHIKAAATLRELERLLDRDLTRIYEYNPHSTNYTLHRHWVRGSDDANIVFLCEPPADAYAHQAVQFVASRMALALLALAQPGVWQAFRNDLRAYGTSVPGESGGWVSAFGVHAHSTPFTPLQVLVRTWLARDVLVGRQWGVMQAWRPAQVEPDEEAASLVLHQADHPFLKALAQARNASAIVRNWPRADLADRALALALRRHLQETVDRSMSGNALLASDQLLAGMEEILLQSSAPFEFVESLQKVITQARQELQNWFRTMRTASAAIETAETIARRRWERSLAQPGCYSVLDKEAAQRTYETMVGGAADLRLQIRQYVRWSWIVEENRLRLRLDTLYPGWRSGASSWRHGSEDIDWHQLWEGTQHVVAVLTQEQRYWPFSLTAVGSHPPRAEEVREAVAPTLAYVSNVAKVAYLSSQDRHWLDRPWLPPGVATSKAGCALPALGVVLQVHHLIPLQAVKGWSVFGRQYGSLRRTSPISGLHVFDPEQQALDIEAQTISTLPRRQREALDVVRLNRGVVAALQVPELVRFFVNAWLSGLVDPILGRGPYYLRIPASAGEGAQELRQLVGNHPLEALQAFVQAGLGPEPDADVTGLTASSAKSGVFPLSDRLQKIAGWWESQDPKNVEWYLLVHGLIGSERP